MTNLKLAHTVEQRNAIYGVLKMFYFERLQYSCNKNFWTYTSRKMAVGLTYTYSSIIDTINFNHADGFTREEVLKK